MTNIPLLYYLKHSSFFRPLLWPLCFIRKVYRHRHYFVTFLRSTNKKSFLTVLKEIFWSLSYWKIFPFFYFRCALYEKGKQFTREGVVNYIPESFFYGVILPKANDKEYSMITENKILTDKFLRSVIPQPSLVCYIENKSIYDCKGTLFNEDIFTKRLQDCADMLFLKPATGAGGNGIIIFRRNDSRFFDIRSGHGLDFTYLKQLMEKGDYILQEGIEQVEDLNKIYPHSVNTLRIITETSSNAVRPVIAILRLGQGNSPVDNSAQGGISVEIDIETWKLCGRGHSEHPVATYIEHPDTHIPFVQELPMKDETFSLLQRAAFMFAKCRYLGWDVALTTEGPVVLEVNDGFGIDHIQITCERGVRKIFSE